MSGSCCVGSSTLGYQDWQFALGCEAYDLRTIQRACVESSRVSRYPYSCRLLRLGLPVRSLDPPPLRRLLCNNAKGQEGQDDTHELPQKHVGTMLAPYAGTHSHIQVAVRSGVGGGTGVTGPARWDPIYGASDPMNAEREGPFWGRWGNERTASTTPSELRLPQEIRTEKEAFLRPPTDNERVGSWQPRG